MVIVGDDGRDGGLMVVVATMMVQIDTYDNCSGEIDVDGGINCRQNLRNTMHVTRTVLQKGKNLV